MDCQAPDLVSWSELQVPSCLRDPEGARELAGVRGCPGLKGLLGKTQG